MKNIVIDDERTFKMDDVVHLRTEDEALAYLARLWVKEMTLPIGVVSQLPNLYLDHDLGEGQEIKAVVDFICTLAEHGARIGFNMIYVHSQNPVGADNVVRQLVAYFGHSYVKRIPLPEMVAG